MPCTMSMTPRSCDLLVVPGVWVWAVVVLLVVDREGVKVVVGRLVEDFLEEDDVQSDSFRPISHPSCFSPAM